MIQRLTLGSHTNTEEKTDDEELHPALGETGADWGDNENKGAERQSLSNLNLDSFRSAEHLREKDASTTTNVVVERVREPASDAGRSDVCSG